MRRRLLLSYLTITVFTLLVLVYPLGRVFALRERDHLLRDIEHDASLVVNLSEDALERGAPPELEPLLTAYARDPGGRIVIVDRTGRVVGDSDVPGASGTDYSDRPEIAIALSGGRAEGTRRSDTLGHDLVYVAVPVASSGTVHGAVRITYPSSTLDARVRTTWFRLALLSGVVVVAVTLVGLLLAREVTLPVERLKRTARRMAAGDLTARAPTDHGAPELRELAHILNDTAARLEATLASQQAFVGDAAHQLRTPLAALRLRLENLEAAAPADLQPGLAAARAETSRLGRLSESLLALTRAAGTAARPEPLDVASVVRERHDAWSPVAEEMGRRLDTDAPAGLRANAVPGALEQIIDNYLDNALDVAPEGSTIRLVAQASSAGAGVEVHVIDHGPGLDPEQRRRAFDRFWRAADAPPGGTGLGLAIVAQLAQASGGTAELRAAEGGGIDAVVSLTG